MIRREPISRGRPGQGQDFEAQRGKILELLRRAGPAGVSNIELTGICFRYGARLWELRRAGHQIRTENRGDGLFVYFLAKAPKADESESMRRLREERDRAMPLFDGTVRR